MLQLKSLRKARRVSQVHVQDATGIWQAYISAFETGRMQPTRDQLILLARVFDVPPDDLLKPVEVER